MNDRYENIAERLRGIEEELRDLAYDRLREAATGDDAAKAEERRLGQARRAVERAIKALSPTRGAFDD